MSRKEKKSLLRELVCERLINFHISSGMAMRNCERNFFNSVFEGHTALHPWPFNYSAKLVITTVTETRHACYLVIRHKAGKSC
jgi:hypothetical protein